MFSRRSILRYLVFGAAQAGSVGGLRLSKLGTRGPNKHLLARKTPESPPRIQASGRIVTNINPDGDSLAIKSLCDRKHSCHRSAAVAPRLALTGVKGWMQPCLFLCPFLLVRVALTLRSLRIHTSRLCRFAVLYYKPTFLPHQGVAKHLITNRIRQTVALGL